MQVDPQALQTEAEKKRELEAKNTILNSYSVTPVLPNISTSKKEPVDNSMNALKRKEFKQSLSSIVVKRLSYYLQKKQIDSKVIIHREKK